MKIKVKLINGGKMPLVNPKGDLFDVYSNADVQLRSPHAESRKQVNNEKIREVKFQSILIPLGFAMEIPKGFKANLYPRSSTFKRWGIIFGNHVGQIDNSYSSDRDEWMVSAIALRAGSIKTGDRIAQFEIVPSQKATFWQKLKWLFSNKIEFEQVAHLNNPTRGGFGSSGDV